MDLKLLISEKYFKYFSPWQASLLAAVISIITSLYDLFHSIASMLTEQNTLIFYLLFFISLESIIFICVSILLIIGVIKKNKFLFIPWLVVACIDVILALTLAFTEISIPGRNYGSPCIVSLASLVITLAICALIVYCFIAVYHQYCLLDQNKSYPNKRKVTPSNLSISEKIHSKSSSGEKGVKFSHSERDANEDSV